MVSLKGIGYYYDDTPKGRFALNKNPFTNDDIKKLKNVVDVLNQFDSLSYFDEAAVIINKLEDKVESHLPTIFFDVNNKLKGLEHMNILANTIRKKIALLLVLSHVYCVV